MKTLTCSWCDASNTPGATTCASCGAPLREEGTRLVMESVARALPPDTVLRDGDYKILSILGQGGFGITYRALNSRLGREVAIKEFFPSSCDREGLLVSPSGGTTALDYENGKAAFLSEARVLARFDHPAIVRVFGAWEENRSAYMEMELLRGQTLAHVLDQYRRLNPHDVLRLFNPILDALQVLHNEGYLHRDIKPQNLMLCGVAQGATDAESCVRHARAVLLDFGAAHHVGNGASQALSVVVTPGYAPLEQYAQRARRGAFTDIYALCATLYHALSGQTPPPASDRAVGQALTPLEDLVSGLPKEWYAAIAAGLQTEIAKRPQSVSELRALMGSQNPAVSPVHTYADAQKFGDGNVSIALPHLGATNLNSPAQSVIAQSLLNAVPDSKAPQVLAAPPLNPQHPLGANTPGQPVALSQPSSAVPLVPPQYAQTPQQQGSQQQTAHQHAQNQSQNNSANDVRMRQVAALLYLGSPIVFALLWWLFAVSSGPRYEPTPPMPPPITQPYKPPPPPWQSSRIPPQMNFSMANSAQSALQIWNGATATITDAALSPDGKWATGIEKTGVVALWDVKNGARRQQLLRLDANHSAHFVFSPDSSKLLVREVHNVLINELLELGAVEEGIILGSDLTDELQKIHYPAKISVIEVESGRVLWSKDKIMGVVRWSPDSKKLLTELTVKDGIFFHTSNGRADGLAYNYKTSVHVTMPLNEPIATISTSGKWFAQLTAKNSVRIQQIYAYTQLNWDGLGSYEFDGGMPLVFAPNDSFMMAHLRSREGFPAKNKIALFDLKTGGVIREWANEPAPNYGSEFDFTISPRGRYIVIRNGTDAVRIWDTRTRRDVVLQWNTATSYYHPSFWFGMEANALGNRVFFSPDESQMLMLDLPARSQGIIRLLDIPTNTMSVTKSPSGVSPLQLQWSPDGKTISWLHSASGNMGHLKVSDFKTSVPLQVLAGAPPQP